MIIKLYLNTFYLTVGNYALNFTWPNNDKVYYINLDFYSQDYTKESLNCWRHAVLPYKTY